MVKTPYLDPVSSETEVLRDPHIILPPGTFHYRPYGKRTICHVEQVVPHVHETLPLRISLTSCGRTTPGRSRPQRRQMPEGMQAIQLWDAAGCKLCMHRDGSWHTNMIHDMVYMHAAPGKCRNLPYTMSTCRLYRSMQCRLILDEILLTLMSSVASKAAVGSGWPSSPP